MIELLLQADRALSMGALDQAERMYWQSIERDSKNAIAIAGLARIAMQRGDTEMARLFGLKALAIDPENAAARRLLDTLNGDVDPAPASPLPLPAIEDLESISRRRIAEEEPEGIAAAEAVEPPAAVEPEPAFDQAEGGDDFAAAETAATLEAIEVFEPTAPIEVEPAPSMSEDDFAAAETAATLEAIDALDDSVVIPEVKRRHSLSRRPRGFHLPSMPRLDLGPIHATSDAERADAAGPAVEPPADLSPEQPPVAFAPKPYEPKRHEPKRVQPPPIVAAPRDVPAPSIDGPSEAEAEAAAFIEALALVDDAPQEATEAVDQAAAAGPAEVVEPVETVEAVDDRPVESVESDEAAEPGVEPGEPVESVESVEPEDRPVARPPDGHLPGIAQLRAAAVANVEAWDGHSVVEPEEIELEQPGDEPASDDPDGASKPASGGAGSDAASANRAGVRQQSQRPSSRPSAAQRRAPAKRKKPGLIRRMLGF